MSDYEIAFPPGAKNFENAEETFVRTSKDGDVPIFALFGGCEFVGKVLEGKFQKGDDGSIQGPFTAKINNGYLELTGRAASAGDEDYGWVWSKNKIYFFDETVIDIHFKLPSRVNGGSESDALAPTSVTNAEGTFRLKIQNGLSSVRVYYHDGTGSIDESQNEVAGSPLDLGTFTAGWVLFCLQISENTNRTVSSDFIRVTYPNFSVKYDLDEDAYQGEGQILSKAWDSSGNGNDGVIYGALWKNDMEQDTKYLRLDGQDDYIVIPDHDSLDLTSGVTIAVQLKKRVAGQWHQILGKDEHFLATTTNVYGLAIRDTDAALFGVSDGTTNDQITSDVTVPANSLTWIIGGWDSTDYYIWVGDTKKSASSTVSSIQTNDADIWIGKNNDAGYPRPAAIDLYKVYVYNRKLSDTEVANLKAGSPPTSGLVLALTFDGGNNRGEVIVWDTMGSSDESDWQRVLSKDHIFVGDCVLENGLVRLYLKDEDYARIYAYNGSGWVNLGRAYTYHLATAELKPSLKELIKVTLEEAIIRVLYSDPTETSDRTLESYFKLRRGNPFLIEEIISASGNVRHEFKDDWGRFAYITGETVVDGQLDHTVIVNSEDMVEPFSISFDTSNSIIRFFAHSRKNSKTVAYSPGSVINSIYHDYVGTDDSGMIFLYGAVFFGRATNLFKEAEDAQYRWRVRRI